MMEVPQPSPEHLFLARFVGDYELVSGEGSGKETARLLGDVWLLIEGHATWESGGHQYVFTLGFDEGRVVGTFVSSMMTRVWTYTGRLDGETLVLDATGPRFDGEPGEARYRDYIRLDADGKTLWSEYEGDDGAWTEFMRSTHRRI